MTTQTFNGVNYQCINTGRGLSRRLYSAIDNLRGNWIAVEFDAPESRRSGMRALALLHKECSIAIRQTCHGFNLSRSTIECRATAHEPTRNVADGDNVILVALR
jgi:hypothetical protein